MKGLGKYPWFWTGLIAIIVYTDVRALNGKWVYDDAGSVIKNVVVNGHVGWKEAFTRDFWGSPLKEAESHKSFRPITTLTLRANWILGHHFKDLLPIHDPEYAEQGEKQNLPPTWNFHATNIALHGVVTALITKATSYILPSKDIVSQIVVGLLFALHPVHAEVVSNVTSRGELLMSMFSLIAFLSYAGTREKCYRQAYLQSSQPSSLNKNSRMISWWQCLLGYYVLPWLCMILSMFSKEQGATTLISVVAWDFLKFHGNLVSLIRTLSSRSKKNTNVEESLSQRAAKEERAGAWQFLKRALVLAMQTLLGIGWRYKLNGETEPDFIEEQNPAGFAKDRFTRVFSVSWVYCLYIRDAIYPYFLSCDWSGRSIELIKSLKDPRAMVVIALWYFSAQSFWTMIFGANTRYDKDCVGHFGTKQATKRVESTASSLSWNESTLRQLNIAIWACTFSPFLLSSNLFVVIGLMKADRVIYFPLFGFCLIEALVISKCRNGAVSMRPALERRKEQLFWGAHFCLMFQLIVLSGRTHDRNLDWSDSLRLWGSAYAVNPRSYHTMYNYGYELSLKQRYVEAEEVMRPIGSARVNGPGNTFVYAMVLFNINRCDRALVLVDEALEVVKEEQEAGGVRTGGLSKTESNLLVAKAHCINDPHEKGRILYKSVEVDPTNEYAVGIASNYMQQLQLMEQIENRNQ